MLDNFLVDLADCVCFHKITFRRLKAKNFFDTKVVALREERNDFGIFFDVGH